jgi:dTMP kinase
MKRGLFITLEGGEGSGKTTQLQHLREALDAASIPHLCTREPGGAPLSEKIRALVVESQEEEWLPTSEMLLFMAARVEHVQRVILPALEAGKVVICDRFHDSSCAYQGIMKGLGVEYYDRLHRMMLGTLTPDITFLLDIAPDIGLQRAAARAGTETRFEALGLAFHMQLRAAFLTLAAAEPQRIHRIDAAQAPSDVHHAIWQTLQPWL